MCGCRASPIKQLWCSSKGEGKIIGSPIHYLMGLSMATGLQNMSCHREIIKQRSTDFGKAAAGCFLR